MKSKNSEELVSIIVPVYNVQGYLRECIDSILKQTYTNIEVILVDDGSTDGSHDICLEYERKDDRVVLITQENQGNASSRNTGLNNVNGSIIGFVDSDDKVDSHMIEKMVDSLDNSGADIVFCGFERFEDGTNEIYSREMLGYKWDSVEPEEYEKMLYLNPGVWNKLYRIEALQGIEFSKLRLCEDLVFLIDIVKKSPKITRVREVLYHYRVRKHSVMNSINKKAYDDLVKVLIRKREEINNDTRSYKLIQLFDALMFMHIGISLTFRFIQSDKKNMKSYISNSRNLLDKEFRCWRNTKYLSFIACLGNGIKGIGMWGCRLLYKIKMFRIFVLFYDFIQTKLHVDIKW